MTGTAVVDFGAGAFNASVDVSEVTVVAGTRVDAYLAVPSTDTPRFRDEYWVEGITLRGGNVVAGVGFTIYASCNFRKALGQFTVQYVTL